MVLAVVFDFDGVIANSEPLHFRAFHDGLAAEGVTLTECPDEPSGSVLCLRDSHNQPRKAGGVRPQEGKNE